MIDPDEVVGAATAADAVDDWIEGSDLERINVAVSDERVTVTIAGPLEGDGR